MSERAGADLTTQCCIAGCGPAGAILGLLLARAGVDVLVLEKHADFLRDFRGDTIHPSTLELLDQLGLADRFLRLPHTRASVMHLRTDAGQDLAIDFGHLPTRFAYIAFVPQWDFLNFITAEAAQYPTFHLLMQAEAVDLLHDQSTVRGLRFRAGDQQREVHADLVVGADGRGSLTREIAALPRLADQAAFDVLWFRLSRHPDDPDEAVGRIGSGHLVATFNRGDYWQIAFSISKDADARVRTAGLAAFRATLARLLPHLADRVDELQDWTQVKLLSVRADRLQRWYRPGYLAIGDAAHAMSPVGGVGINVAIQDAVAAANILWQPLLNGTLSVADLARVQRQRQLPVRIIQGLQAGVQRAVFQRVLSDGAPFRLPWLAEVLLHVPLVRDIPARVLALGVFRPRVLTPSAPARSVASR